MNPAKKPDSLQPLVDELQAKLARALADYQNLEKRYTKDSAAVVKFANAGLLEKLLDVRDHLAAAAAHLQDQSLTMILANLDNILADEGLKQVDTAVPFDPKTMEVSDVQPGEKDKVLSIVRPGYILHDRVLRTARVVVGNGQKVTNK